MRRVQFALAALFLIALDFVCILLYNNYIRLSIKGNKSMLQIKNVTKDYVVTKDLTVHALKGVSLNFRKSEFVSILGPSGCGKTTLLNIIGGLDRYSQGDIAISGKSTKEFRDSDWDTYRNRSIGFVFQNYNLIPNMNVLDNIMLSLSVAGESRSQRIKRAKEALYKVGLINQIKKYPNQLSGGQMQRVAIARAIVNDPDVILADEPTGALDSETGVQVMELLKQISADRLVIMVTHNQELADAYSTRIVKMVDGELVGDSNPYTDEQLQVDEQSAEATQSGGFDSVENSNSKKPKKSRMSILTAFAISLKNLRVKLGRTLLISFAGSISIFGIALVLAISGGMSNYVDYMQTQAVGDSAIRLGETAYSLSRILSVMEDASGINNTPYPTFDGVDPYQRESFSVKNTLSEEFIEYVQNIDQSWIKAINYTYSVQMHVLQKNDDKYTLRSNWASNAHQMIEEDELIEDNYDWLYKSESSETGYPKDYTEVSLVVDRYNRISPGVLNNIGITVTRNPDGSYNRIPFSDIVDKEYEIVLNDGWYQKQENGNFKTIASGDYKNIKEENKIKVKIVSILRVKNKKGATLWLDSGLAYLPELSEFLVENAKNSEIGQAQLEATDHNVLTGKAFTIPSFGTDKDKEANVRSQQMTALKDIGAYTVPTNIQIYPKDINSKKNISNYIDEWNTAHKDQEVTYLDLTELAISMLSTFIDVVTYVLIVFSAIALLVSTVMISVITYTSVVERVKVIGVLRSIGARKSDIANLFNTETLLIGTFAGTMGVVLAVLCGVVGNFVLGKLMGVASLVIFTWQIIVGMLVLSIGLTLLAGLIPAVIAAKKDPVTCLRTD